MDLDGGDGDLVDLEEVVFHVQSTHFVGDNEFEAIFGSLIFPVPRVHHLHPHVGEEHSQLGVPCLVEGVQARRHNHPTVPLVKIKIPKLNTK